MGRGVISCGREAARPLRSAKKVNANPTPEVAAMSKIATPEILKGRARTWFEEMLESYEGFDSEPNSVSVLTEAAVQLMRLDEYRKAIERDGAIIQDRYGSPKEHPAAVAERSAANSHRLLCREMGVEPAQTAEDVRLPRIASRSA